MALGVRTKTWTLTGTKRNCEIYSRKQVLKALRLYRKCGSVTKTIRILGYPSRESMYLWIKNSEYMNPRDRIDKRPPHKCHLTIAEKEYAVKRCFYDGESVKSVSEELGCIKCNRYKKENFRSCRSLQESACGSPQLCFSIKSGWRSNKRRKCSGGVSLPVFRFIFLP